MPFLCKGFCKLPPTRELSRRLKVSRVVITIGTAQALDLMLRTLAPLESMAIENPGQRVVYIGSFSKTMFPGLRLGFCVVPEKFINRFLELKWFSDRCTPILEQLALAEWLESGIFERHVRKMRAIYAKRREIQVKSLRNHFGNRIHIHGVPAGMHILIDFHLKLSEAELTFKALKAGVKVYPAGSCYIEQKPKFPSLIMGFGNLNEVAIEKGAAQLAGALREWIR